MRDDAHAPEDAHRPVAPRESSVVAAGQLLSHVAHDMRHVLSRCQWKVDGLTRDPSQEGLRRALAFFGEAAAELQVLSDRLSVARALHVKGEEDHSSRVNEEVAKVVQAHVRGQGSEGCTVGLALNAGRDTVRLAPAELRQVVSALLMNAVEAGASHVSVSTDNRADAAIRGIPVRNGVRLVVQDDGRGPINENPERLFELGYTTKAGRHGVGLTIARSLARRVGGELLCDVPPPQLTGTVFSAVLPLSDL